MSSRARSRNWSGDCADRGTEIAQLLERRLEVARREMASIDIYRYRVVNEEIDLATREICDILNQESLQQAGDVSE